MMQRILVTGGSGFIGTNLTQHLSGIKIDFCNIDLAAPKDESLQEKWIRCDILDYTTLEKHFLAYKPNVIVHLAAETDTDPSKSIDDYRVNVEGTLNVINATKAVGSVKHFVLTSTQFVNQSSKGPTHDEDYDPHTIYGESKIITEHQIRNANLNCTWTIIRPTNIWGPWHLRYPYEFWKILAEEKYFHPGRQKVLRSYGYVGNVVYQIIRILELSPGIVDGKVYYVGDRPIDLYNWVIGFSLKQTGKKVRIVPRFFVFFLAIIGNVLRLTGIKFPITLSRYRSMTTSNPADMEKTFSDLGPPKYTLQQGIDETVIWMKKVHPHLVHIP